MKQPKKSASVKKPGKTSQSVPVYLLAGVLLFVLVAFYSSIKNGFTNWDDPSLITENPLIKELSLTNLKRIFTENYFGNYQPLHLFSYALEYHFFGLNPEGYHMVSIMMHLVNTILVFYVVRFFTQENNMAALSGALLWAINPMRTESVCWAAERKDMLYAMFFFMAMLSYLKYVSSIKMKSRQELILLIAAFLFFTLSVFSKAMAVSLIPVLLLIDYYYKRKPDFRLFAEKIPFALLAVLMGLRSVSAASAEGSVDTSGNYTILDRLFFASQNLLMYAIKSIFPFSQSAFYDYPEKAGNFLPYSYYISGFVIVLISGYLISRIFKNRELVFICGYFIATVFLVLMILPVGPTIFNERYTYVPSVMIFAGTMNFLFNEKRFANFNRNILMACIILTAILYAYKTNERSKVWNNSTVLWSDAVSKSPKAAHALNNLGDAYFNSGQIDSAIIYFTKAIEINPNYASALYNRGNAYGQTGKATEALVDLDRSIQFDPKRAEAYNKRGQANALTGHLDKAFEDFAKALALKPDYAEVYFNLGITYLNTNQKNQACENLRKAANMGFENAVKPLQQACN